MQSKKRRLSLLEKNRLDGQETRPGYISVLDLADLDGLDYIPPKVYIGISPDDWDQEENENGK